MGFMESMFSRHPRLRGVVIIVGALVCARINVATMRAWNQYRVGLFPFAFAALPVGVIVLLSGWSPGKPIGKRYARMIVGMMALGAVAGFALNHVLTH